MGAPAGHSRGLALSNTHAVKSGAGGFRRFGFATGFQSGDWSPEHQRNLGTDMGC